LFPELLKKSSYLFKTCVILILFLPVVSMIVFPYFIYSFASIICLRSFRKGVQR